jgi:hypothetical protein
VSTNVLKIIEEEFGRELEEIACRREPGSPSWEGTSDALTRLMGAIIQRIERECITIPDEERRARAGIKHVSEAYPTLSEGMTCSYPDCNDAAEWEGWIVPLSVNLSTTRDVVCEKHEHLLGGGK